MIFVDNGRMAGFYIDPLTEVRREELKVDVESNTTPGWVKH